MDFSSEKRATLDEKGRVVLPTVYKNQMGGKIPSGQMAIVVDPFKKCLNVYPVETWEAELTEYKAKLNRNNPKKSRLLDLIYRNFKIINVPDSCRMNIPDFFLQKVSIKKDVVFVGVADMIRLWDVNEYDAYMGDGDDYGSLMEELLGGDE